MTRYLLDTNAVSHLMRQPGGLVARKIAEVGQFNVSTSVLVTAELLFGLEHGGSLRLREQFDQIAKGLIVMTFESPADVCYGHLRS